MSREYVIYTDESSKTGRYFANFYGGALIRSEDLDYVREDLQAQAARLGLGAEIKWQKVSEGYLDRYMGMMDAFFDLIACRPGEDPHHVHADDAHPGTHALPP